MRLPQDKVEESSDYLDDLPRRHIECMRRLCDARTAPLWTLWDDRSPVAGTAFPLATVQGTSLDSSETPRLRSFTPPCLLTVLTIDR